MTSASHTDPEGMKELERALANEQTARADVEVEFNARRADLEAKFNLDTERLQELERALEGLNQELAQREKTITTLRTDLDQSETQRTALADENESLKSQYQQREESFKKLRMAIAVASTFAGQVGDDEADTSGDEAD